MAEIIRMPKMSDTMEEGTIARWLKKVGDTIKSGDVLAEVETDKATMELESYEEGTLLHIEVKEQQPVKIDGMIAIIGKQGEKIEHILNTSLKTIEIKNTQPPHVKDENNIKASVIKMPKMSDTMVEGTINRWLKKIGDTVKSGDILAEVDTDKATMELEAYDEGILLYTVEPQKSIVINGIIAIIGEKDTDISKLLNNTDHSTIPKTVEKTDEKTMEFMPEKVSSQTESRIKISPIARKIAVEKNIDIKKLQGSGDNGRIIKRDIEILDTQTSPIKIADAIKGIGNNNLQESFEDSTVSSMRKTIAKRLSESKFTSPHFYLTIEICMDKAIEARNSLNADSSVKISFNDLIIKASATALHQHRDINSSWLGDKIRKNHHIHIGVAVAVPDGLLVPVVRFANTKSLSQISAEVKDLGQRAKEKKLQPADWEGSTFSISNLGMFGIDEFTAIINPPNACILAVGGIKQTPIVKNGQIVIGNMLKVTLSCDHRVVDGATGAVFLATLKKLIEDPIKILL